MLIGGVDDLGVSVLLLSAFKEIEKSHGVEVKGKGGRRLGDGEERAARRSRTLSVNLACSSSRYGRK